MEEESTRANIPERNAVGKIRAVVALVQSGVLPAVRQAAQSDSDLDLPRRNRFWTEGFVLRGDRRVEPQFHPSQPQGTIPE